MEKLYKQLLCKLESLDFNKLYPGFKQYIFALYNSDKVYFYDKTILWDERFLGNTAIFYEGEYIAIWNLEHIIENLDIFTSKIVHEMFHAHQLTMKEKRFPNEIKALQYRYNNENISMKYDETQEMLKGNIDSFISKRNYRRQLYKNEVDYETYIEQVEGSARFVELQALKTLNKSIYNKEIIHTKKRINNIVNYLPVRTLSYEIGAILFEILTEKNIKYNSSFDIEETIFDQINIQDSIHPYNHLKHDTRFIESYYIDLKSKIDKVLNTYAEKLEFIRLTGLDPMNTFTYKNYTYYKNFVRIELPNNQMKMVMKEAVSELDEPSNKFILYL